MLAASYDIIIVGGGMVGLTLACALAQQTSLSIAVLEAHANSHEWSEKQCHHRVSALALSSRRIFQSLNVWDEIKQRRISPFSQIYVCDAAKHGEVSFKSHDIAESVLGYIVENNLLQSVLLEKLSQSPQITYLAPVQLKTVHVKERDVEIVLEDGYMLKARLAVAADGAQSWLRQQVNIPVKNKSYDQEAIVASIHTDIPHQQCAQQVFLPTGPLAFLPLVEEKTSSIVWSLPTAEAERLLALDDESFIAELNRCVMPTFGLTQSISKRFSFPLHQQQATHYVQPRIALVGDAAHTIHPLAGQGVNMGLLDAASLVDVIQDAIKQQRDFASISTLRRYERWRRADNQPMMIGVDAIKQLFASELSAVQSTRSLGLSITNQLQSIKNFFSRQAVGNRLGLPRLAAVKH